MSRIALVTGGTRGIGASISKALKNAGHNVAANFSSNEEAAKKFELITRQFPYDAPTTLLLKRCRHLCEHPPSNWDGVHRMSFK